MKKALFLVAAATLFLFSCQKEIEFEPTHHDGFTLTASIETLATKADLSTDKLVWKANDEIGICVTTSSWGEKNQEFKLVGAGGTTTGQFEWAWGDFSTSDAAADAVAAFFPWDGQYKSGETDHNNVGNDGTVAYFHMRPSYDGYTSAKLLAPLAAKVEYDAGTYKPIDFKHAGAAIKLTVSDIPSYTSSISLTADKNIVGWYNFPIANVDADPVPAMTLNTGGEEGNTVTLIFAEGNTGAFDFIFPVPALTGPTFKFELKDKNGVTVWSKRAKPDGDGNLGRADLLEFAVDAITPYAKFTKVSAFGVRGKVNGVENWDSAIYQMVTDNSSASIAKGVALYAGDAIKATDGTTWSTGYNYYIDADGTYDVIYLHSTGELKVVATGGCPYPDVPAPVLTVERLWGFYPNTGWPTNYMNANADRGVATDGEYVYIANANTTQAEVVAIKISDQSKKTVNVTGIADGYFATACARTIYNPATGKYILLVGSLANADETKSSSSFNVYAWPNGIDDDPVMLVSWDTNNGSVRRVGDFFTVSGDWSNGEIWARIYDNTASSTFVWKITNGVAGGVIGGGIGYAGSAGMGSVYKYSLDAPSIMVVTQNIAKFYTCTVKSTWIDANSAGIEWTDGSDVSAYAKRFGYTPFEFNGKKFIAYLHMYNAARGWLTILNDTQGTAEGFMQTIIDNDIFFQGAVQIESDTPSTDVVSGATYSGNAMANCAVAVMGDHVILVGHQQNTGLAVFKMSLK